MGVDTFIRVGTAAASVMLLWMKHWMELSLQRQYVMREITTIHYIPIEYPQWPTHVVEALARAARKLGYYNAEGITIRRIPSMDNMNHLICLKPDGNGKVGGMAPR